MWTTVPSLPDLELTEDRNDLVRELLLRIKVLEAAMAQMPGVGHNDAPLNAQEILSVRMATDILAQEAVADTPNIVAISESIGKVRHAYLKVGKWLLLKLDKAVDESIKWAVPFGMAEMIILSHQLGDVVSLAAQLLQHLGGN
jgi:hypothetical protein